MHKIDTKYQASEIEAKWENSWRPHYEPSGQGETFCIILPPPNVTGSLHLGHALQTTLMDIICRYKRMQGNKVRWQPGTDHAGIATQLVVKNRLAQQGVNDLPRADLIQEIWKWKAYSGNTIEGQFQRLGASLAWDKNCFTMDAHCNEGVSKAFVELYQQGIIYRGTKLVNWDPSLQTAISDLELSSKTINGKIYHLRYLLQEPHGKITSLEVATTRPETIFGDVAIAVNPEDERYRELIGRQVLVPIINRTIPIIADELVEIEFGSGCLKVTPAHDFNDYAIGQRHKLASINILNKDASLNQEVPESYRGLSTAAARTKIIAELQENGSLVQIKEHQQEVPISERTGTIIEPMLTKQWFLAASKLAPAAIAAVKSGEIKFIPGNWDKTYYHWMENIQDWCISRQIWWGHQIPAWYDEQGEIYVGRNEEEVRQNYKLAPEKKLERDSDVLDTWFSSALWPMLSMGWPAKQDWLEFYPTDVLVTGFDIIFFWVARMIMFSLHFTQQIPFKQIYIHGLIQDAQGQKMSKSKGNIIDPLDLIQGIGLPELITKRTANLMQQSLKEQITKQTTKLFPKGINAYGVDALRFGLCLQAVQGKYLCFDLAKLETARTFCNKLWNATKFVSEQEIDNALEASLADRWILAIWQLCKQELLGHLATYRFDLLAQTIYDFVWNEFCSWYIEFSKIANTKSPVIVKICQEILLYLHPVIPFITEELWQYFRPKELAIISPLPLIADELIDKQAIEQIELCKELITTIRELRLANNLKPKELSICSILGAGEQQQIILEQKDLLMKLGKLENLSFERLQGEVLAVSTGHISIQIPKNTSQDLEHLLLALRRAQEEADKLELKFQNPAFASKAPAALVAKEQERLNQLREKIKELQTQI